MQLSNKTAIVTGSTSGIGLGIAQELAKAGANVVLNSFTDNDEDHALANQLSADHGIKAVYQKADMSKADACRDLIAQTHAKMGSVDILVNNAGLIDPIARIENSEPDAWSHVVDVNLKGVYYGIRHCLPHMKSKGAGTIINISSGAATGALEGWSHYCATKAAVLSLTKCVHKEEADNGIRMIGLSPGTVATEMQVQIKSSGVNPVSQLDPTVHIPPEWVAQTIAFLCTPAADEWRGTDFSMKTNEGRAAVGLPPV